MTDSTRQTVLALARGARRRWRRERATATALLAGWITGGALAAALSILAWRAPIGAAAWALAIVPGVGTLTWLGVAMRPRPLPTAARIADSRLGLKQEFPTAVELAIADTHSPAADACMDQAIAAMGGRAWAPSPTVARTIQHRAALLAISLTLCAALAAWNVQRVAANQPTSLAGMSVQQRDALAATFAAGAEANAGELRRLLQATAVSIEAEDEAALAEHLEELRRRGYIIVELEVPAVRNALGLPPESPNDAPAGQAEEIATHTPATDVPFVPAGVNTYQPERDGVGLASGPAAGVVPFEEAWDHARRRAMDNLNQGQTPPKYRDAVRHYFTAP